MQQDPHQPQSKQKDSKSNPIREDRTQKSEGDANPLAVKPYNQFHQFDPMNFYHQMSPFQGIMDLNRGGIKPIKGASPGIPGMMNFGPPSFMPFPFGGPPQISGNERTKLHRPIPENGKQSRFNKDALQQMSSPFLGALKYLPQEDDRNNQKETKQGMNFLKPKDALIEAINNTKSSKDKQQQIQDQDKSEIKQEIKDEAQQKYVKKQRDQEEEKKKEKKGKNLNSKKQDSESDSEQSDDPRLNNDDDEISAKNQVHITNRYNLFMNQQQYNFQNLPGQPHQQGAFPSPFPFMDFQMSPFMGHGPNTPGDFMNNNHQYPHAHPFSSPYPFTPGSMFPPGFHPMMPSFSPQIDGGHGQDFGFSFQQNQHQPPPFAPYMCQQQPMFKVPLPPRKEGEAPSFVFYKQARRILFMRSKKARKNDHISQPNHYFTRLRQVGVIQIIIFNQKYKSRQNVAKNRQRENNGRFKKKDQKRDQNAKNDINTVVSDINF
ncbi:UNKNOWN [Stylonychia lemnae]|uniref:Uncharacterized protein n=1 Tax=Stylonychia lemnae TaxID=5949 RepID=A0A078AIS5_STYLE|nr:UNKNOWN [Stylonychia lemnae]|eukprot:CDW82124.1 UNKNOWN [Stylonychia lemnae]